MPFIVIVFKIYFTCTVYIYVHLDVTQTQAMVKLSDARFAVWFVL